MKSKVMDSKIRSLSHVKAFGFELEGGWDQEPPERHRLVRDGSVTATGAFYVGELPSPVFATSIEQLVEASTFLEDNYPDHVAESCGLHVHMSFGPHKNGALGSLAVEPYQKYLYGRIAAWAKEKKVQSRALWDRLAGQNNYCRLGLMPSALITRANLHNRYFGVNLQSIWKHGTVEIRVLPAFRKPETAFAAIWRVLTTTERWLALNMTALVKRPEILEAVASGEDDDEEQDTVSVAVPAEPLLEELVQTAPGGNL